MSFIFLRNRVTGGAAFDPASLFSSGEEGAWYEPSTTTCFTATWTGSAFTDIAAAGYGDLVAIIEDQSGNVNDATQTDSSKRPILARVPSTGRRNLLESSTDLSTWVVPNGCSLEQNGSEDPLGDVSWRFTSGTTAVTYNQARLLDAVSISAGAFTWSIYAKQGTARYIAFGHGSSLVVSNVAVSVIFDLQTGQFSDTLNGPNSAYIDSYSAEDTGNGWWRIEFQSDLNSANYDNIVFGISPDGTYANLGHVGTGIYADFSAPQIEFASSATAYQKVVDQYDITEAGVTSIDYLFDDEADDAISWTAPADTDYTIARVDTSGNVTILTGQSLSGATDILLEQDIAGYVAVDRALTSQETTDLTAYLEALV